jgi:hypothetical protein
MHSLARGDHSPHTTVQCVFGGASFGRCGRRKQVQLGFFGYSTNSFARPSRAGPARPRCLVAFLFVGFCFLCFLGFFPGRSIFDPRQRDYYPIYVCRE